MTQIKSTTTIKVVPPQPNSEVTALTLSQQRVANNFNWWDAQYIRITGFTVAVAGLLFIVQFIAHGKGKRLQEIQEAVIKAKDRQLETDLQAKEEEISRLKNATGELDKQNI